MIELPRLTPSFVRSLRGEARDIIEKYASLVDEDYRVKTPPTPPTTPPPPPSDNTTNTTNKDTTEKGSTPKSTPADESSTKDNTTDKDDQKRPGFFKNAFGKFKNKVCHDEKDDKNKDQ
ncbi:hypothetical protein BC941DRAFT_458082 [Chlamydoabsidia padenii]|nr:hypothetical protein BC941DRAFT_458082 [Chlamydoabsidia padenii]